MKKETNATGYLISRYDYDVFDEILIFILEIKDEIDPSFSSYHKISMFGQGVKRITSKNSRNLIFGNYLDVVFFQSQKQDKLSKLKKVLTLDSVGQKISNSYLVTTINFLIEQVNNFNHHWFFWYQKYLYEIYRGGNDLMLTIYSIIDFLFLNGVTYILNHCVICEKQTMLYTFSKKHRGVICKPCYDNLLLNEKVYDVSTIKMFIKICYKTESIEIDDDSILFSVLFFLNDLLKNDLGINLKFIKNFKDHFWLNRQIA
ncbi:DNA repair protein RecO [Ureaplasma canigenitalium]|uniref:DNA repair protein RecO n=1 Tax=Ureaplasma canigenitalium TaxID=42092 RepID=UPI0004E238AD|nr:DNA repair protein RecO [Ureaplasma canigenitalium]